MQGKNILITGATGFIGSSIARQFVDKGDNVVCLSRSSGKTQSRIPKGATIVTGDVCDYNLMSDIISSKEIDYIFHMAANSIVRNSARDPMSTYRSNVMGTVALLEAARNVGRCKKIIVASSDKAYGDHDVLPYVESMSLQPKNTYDTSKACADLISRSYAHNYNMPIVVTRCSNVYGPGDPNMSRIIPNTITRILRNERPVLYSDVAEMEREFIYIDDVVSAYELITLSDNRTHGNAYNVGGTGVYTVSKIVDAILTEMKSNLTTTIVEREPIFKEIKRQFIDAKKISNDVGWSPKVDLNKGLATTIEWYKSLY